jgi:hypothetical protein
MNEDNGIYEEKCKFCGAGLEHSFANIEFYKDRVQLEAGGRFTLIPTYICSHCFLVQSVSNVKLAESENIYLSSFSSSRLLELQKYTNLVFKKFENENSRLVAEFMDPRLNRDLQFANRNLHTLIDVYGKADFLLCHDAVTYATDINDFVSAIKLFLKPEGSVTFEFLYLLPWMAEKSGIVIGDTFPYYSFTTFDKILKYHGLVSYDVIECSPPGSLRVYAAHKENHKLIITNNVRALRGGERDKGISELNAYLQFQNVLMDSNLRGQVDQQLKSL